MSDNPFIHEDNNPSTETKFCPLLKQTCLGERCQWWVTDFMENRRAQRVNCAVAIIAQGVTDEALLKLKHSG